MYRSEELPLGAAINWLRFLFISPIVAAELLRALQVEILNTLFIGTFNLNLYAGFSRDIKRRYFGSSTFYKRAR